MSSWAELNKIVERRMTKNTAEEFAGRSLSSLATVLTDEELLAKLRYFGVELDRPSLEQLCEKALSAEEIAKPLLKDRVFMSKQEELESDWIWICLTELWRRWFPDKPCFELLDNKMQDGYDLLKSGQAKAACSLWLDVWRDVLRIFDKTGMRSIKEFDQQFRGTEFVSNWVQDLEMELWNAGLQERHFLAARIALCEEILLKLPTDKSGREHDITTGNWRRALAESYFEIGETKRAEKLFREWLDDEPQWGWGWIGWSDCYFFRQPSAEDLERSEQLLREGLAIADVRDRSDVLERLAGVYDEQGRGDQAREVRKQIKDSAAVLRTRREIHSGGIFDQRIASREILPFFNQLAAIGQTLPKNTVGRKEPCPCGSGKKFKRCCGSD
jgi:tetratricopeptide (TPR) repeat protein